MDSFKSGFNNFVTKSREAISGEKQQQQPTTVTTYNNTPTHYNHTASNSNTTTAASSNNNTYNLPKPPVQKTPPPPPPSAFKQQPNYTINKQPSTNNVNESTYQSSQLQYQTQQPQQQPPPQRQAINIITHPGPQVPPHQQQQPIPPNRPAKVPLSKPPPSLSNSNSYKQAAGVPQQSQPAYNNNVGVVPPKPRPTAPPPFVQQQQNQQQQQPIVNLEKSYQPQYDQQQPQYDQQQQQPIVNLEKSYQPQYDQQQAPPQPIVSLEKRTTTYQQKDGASEYYQQHQQAVTTYQQNNTPTEKATLSTSLSKTRSVVDTHARIAMTTIGAGEATVKADYPELLLMNSMYVATLQYTEIILEIDDVKVKPCIVGKKEEPVVKNSKFIIYKTVVDDTVIFQFNHIFIYTNLKEKTACRIYPYHYLISDNFNRFFILKLPKNTPQESLDKLEVLFTFYSSYFRTPVKESYNDKTAQKMENATGKIEKGSLVVSKGLVTGGTYFAKGAAKVGEFYKNNTKKYEGPEMTEEQARELEDPDSDANKSKKSAEKFAQNTASVKNGIVGAFGFVGSKASEGVRKTDWYKEREEKKRQEEELNGKNEKKAAGSSMGGAGINAITNVWNGLEEGVLISSRGVRDASVDATRHKHGDYQAELSKKKWDSAGNCTISVVNIMSIVSTTWIKGALYAAAGAIKYDPDKAQNLTGSYWKAGWVVQKSSLLSGSNWSPRWMVLRNPTLALYSSPLDPSDKPISSYYINKVKGVKKLNEERILRSYGFEVVTAAHSLYLSTYSPEVDWSGEIIQPPHPESELLEWIDSIMNVSTFIGENMN